MSVNTSQANEGIIGGGTELAPTMESLHPWSMSKGLYDLGTLNLSRELIDRVGQIITADDFNPTELIDTLKLEPHLGYLYKQPAVREGYSIEEHTLMVLRQFERYFSEIDLPVGINRSEMRLMLALHDIGKGIDADRGEQHQHTVKVLQALFSTGLFEAATFRLFKSLISADPIGKFLFSCVQDAPSAEDKLILAQSIARGRRERADFEQLGINVQLVSAPKLDELTSQAANTIKCMAADSNLALKEFFEILVIYYQCDTTAYTFDVERDSTRSQILTESEGGKIKFNHDQKLDPTPGLEMEPGDATWQIYARLEASGRAKLPNSFPLSRGYPSLDFLYQLSPDFDPADRRSGLNMFVVDYSNKRLYFSRTIHLALRFLEGKLELVPD